VPTFTSDPPSPVMLPLTSVEVLSLITVTWGLRGSIRAGNEAITYYKDPHELAGKCDFVMANPPFNVDEVDAEKVKGDPRDGRFNGQTFHAAQ